MHAVNDKDNGRRKDVVKPNKVQRFGATANIMTREAQQKPLISQRSDEFSSNSILTISGRSLKQFQGIISKILNTSTNGYRCITVRSSQIIDSLSLQRMDAVRLCPVSRSKEIRNIVVGRTWLLPYVGPVISTCW